MKKITNEYFINFCNVIKSSLTDEDYFCQCLSSMKNASEDIENQIFVYDGEQDMEVIKLDEYTKDFDKWRHLQLPELKESHKPCAVDAVCINKSNEWFLIEFKNEFLERALNTVPKKLLSSLWLIGYLFSKSSHKFSEENDFVKFARENITFITVVNSEKNTDIEETIGTFWNKDGPFYTPSKFKKYKGYYFKNIYLLTELGLKSFIISFE